MWASLTCPYRDIYICFRTEEWPLSIINSNNVHLSCTHEHLEYSHDTYQPKHKFYQHAEHSPTNLHKVLYKAKESKHTKIKPFIQAWHWSAHTHTHTHAHTHTHTHTHTHMHTHTHTHTHNDCSRNWVLILAGAEILWEAEGFQFGFKRWQGSAVSN